MRGKKKKGAGEQEEEEKERKKKMVKQIMDQQQQMLKAKGEINAFLSLAALIKILNGCFHPIFSIQFLPAIFLSPLSLFFLSTEASSSQPSQSLNGDTGSPVTLQAKTTKNKEREAIRNTGAVGFLSFADGV